MPDIVKYPQNPIDAFQSGCLLDLRVRLAVEFLKSNMFYGACMDMKTSEAATYALNLASDLITIATESGLIDPLPEDGNINQSLRNQAKRQSQYQTLQQIEAQIFGRAEQERIAMNTPAFGGSLGKEKTN